MPVTGVDSDYADGYTLYAKWEAAGQTATINWNKTEAIGGGENILISTETSILNILVGEESGLTLATVAGYKVNGWAREALPEENLEGKETYTIGEEGSQKTLVKLTAEDLMPYVSSDSTYTIYALWKAEDYQKVKENIESILDKLGVSEDQLVVDGTVNEMFTKKENYIGEENKGNYDSAIEALLLYDKLTEEDKENLTEDQKKALDELKKTIAEVNHTYIDADGNSINVTKEGLPWNVVVEGKTFNVTNAEGEGYDSTLQSIISGAMGGDASLSGSEAIALVTGITVKELSLNSEGTTSNEIVSSDYAEEIQGATITITLNKDNADKYKEYQGFTVSGETPSYTLGETVYKDTTITIESVTDESEAVIGEKVSFTLGETESLPEIIGLVANLDQFTVTFDLNDDTGSAKFKETENVYELGENNAVVMENGSPKYEVVAVNNTITCKPEETIKTLNRTAISSGPNLRMFYQWNTQADGKGTAVPSGSDFTPTESCTLYAIWVLAFDTNNDKTVNTLDYSIIQKEYGKIGNNLTVDVNYDGNVGTLDYSTLQRVYGKTLQDDGTLK